MYHFANLVSCKDSSGSLEPDLPNYIVGYASVSPKSSECNWCLCDSGIDSSYEGSFDELDLISDKLETLLYSASKYPPALALSLREANLQWPITKLEYQDLLVALLSKNLRAQLDSKYILCEVVGDQSGYFSKGEFVWVIAYDSELGVVKWVSDDFYIYSDSVHNFNISSEALRILANT